MRHVSSTSWNVIDTPVHIFANSNKAIRILKEEVFQRYNDALEVFRSLSDVITHLHNDKNNSH